MIFKISLATILLFFPIIIECMNNEKDEKLLEDFAKQQGVKELVNCMMDDINMRNEYSAVDHFHPNFRMEQKDRPNDLPMDRHEYVDSLMNTGPHSLNMANMLAISHSGSMTFGFQNGTMLSFGRDKKPYDFETTEEQEPSTSDRKMNPLIRGMEGFSISDHQGRKSNLLVRGSEGPSTSDGRRSKFWDFDPKAQKFSEYLDDRRKKERKERKEARLRQNADSEDSGRLDHVEGFLKSLEKGGGLG
ncbi:unnamed protein product [Caenorhabditis angaria]|uniref:Uncharacterized protein n=1 Tax=Caenorhabditis angaria TaxID=860376 RepID=A0A9P1IB72_9PELO|nr:unnamed protein product [Caenorhabditis angaria]